MHNTCFLRPCDRVSSRVVAAFFLLLASSLGVLTNGSAFAAESFKPVKLIVQPAALELRGAQSDHGLLVTAVASDGRLLDVTAQAKFASQQPGIVTISTNGVCRAVSDGTAEILVSFGGKSGKVSVVAAETSRSRLPSFRQDVQPVLTRAGCNMGACHGKLAGQNGFKLSLRAYAPEQDITSLTTDVSGRRINPAFPDESLLVLKALGKVPHEGHQRFAEGSRYHQTLVEWIAARCPGPTTNEADVARIEILPGHRVLRVGETQPLLARAFYQDGSTRDVTWLAQFFSNDENTASVTPDGLVKALRHGETSIRAHFQGQVEVVMISIPYTNKVQSRDFAKGNSALDEAVFAKLKALRIPPSAACDDATFLRRASLDATGTLPNAEQVRAFAADAAKDKRAKLVERLLAGPEFVDYWTLQLADLLQNRKERDHDVRGTKGVRSFHNWLRGEVAVNRPWNELAHAVITASGDVVATPAIGYYITTIGEKKAEESEVVDSVAQAFLGTRVGCARCHNHPLEKFTQDDYYHFAAFFSKVSLQRKEPGAGGTTLFTESKDEQERKKKMNEVAKSLAEVETQMASAAGDEAEKAKKKLAEQQKKLAEARQDYEKVMAKMPGVTQPRTKKFMEPQPLDRSRFEFKPGADVRASLANWIVDPKNPQFSAAMVNRLWRHFMGVGLVEPVDDLRASNPPTNPELLKVLTQEFVAHGYDLKHVMRLILNSRAYQLSSATRAGNETDRKFYSHYFARRLPAEVILDAISRATGVPDDFKGYPVGTRAIQLPEPGIGSYFLSLFGRSDRVTACACERNGEVTLPQLLHLQNGDATGKKVRADDSRLTALLKATPDDAKLVEELFLATLNRRPTAAELTKVTASMTDGAREETFSDLFWALLNSKEFAFNH